MKLTELSPFEQGQLAVAVANILTQGITTTAEADILLYLLNAVRDNVGLFALDLKFKQNKNK